MESDDLKNLCGCVALLLEEKDNHNHEDKRNTQQGAEDRQLLESEKAHLAGKFVIVASLVAMCYIV